MVDLLAAEVFSLKMRTRKVARNGLAATASAWNPVNGTETALAAKRRPVP